jgi:hypothetical protein
MSAGHCYVLGMPASHVSCSNLQHLFKKQDALLATLWCQETAYSFCCRWLQGPCAVDRALIKGPDMPAPSGERPALKHPYMDLVSSTAHSKQCMSLHCCLCTC